MVLTKTPVEGLVQMPSPAGEMPSRSMAASGHAVSSPRQVNWSLNGSEFIHSNPSLGCGCGLHSWFTGGKFHVLTGVIIESGYRGTTKLDGLKVAVALSWRGPIPDDNGELVPIIDRNADADQASALMHVLRGESKDPGASFFQLYSKAYAKVHPPVFAEISRDIASQTCHLRIRAMEEANGKPDKRSPDSESADSIKVMLAHRFEDVLAEIARGWSQGLEAASLNLVSPISLSSHADKKPGNDSRAALLRFPFCQHRGERKPDIGSAVRSLDLTR